MGFFDSFRKGPGKRGPESPDLSLRQELVEFVALMLADDLGHALEDSRGTGAARQ